MLFNCESSDYFLKVTLKLKLWFMRFFDNGKQTEFIALCKDCIQ